MFLRRWRASPVKLSLTAFSVALGTAVLVVSFSAGAIIKDPATSGLDRNGGVLYVANATWNGDGSQERATPGEWDVDAPAKVVAESGAASSAALVSDAPFDEAVANGTSCRLRSAVGTGPEYFEVFSLKLAAGSPMDAQDISLGSKHAWISEELAIMLFGSAEAAIGKRVQPLGRLLRRMPGSYRTEAPIAFCAVSGVFAAPSEVARRSYGIADFVLPYTALIAPGMNAAFRKRMMSGAFVVKTSATSAKKAEAAIRQVLSADYPKSDGKSPSVIVWEGDSRGSSAYLRRLRQAIGVFSVSASMLGLGILAIGGLGIFSVMVAELLGHRREIALLRAIGASRADVVMEFWTWSVALSLIGAMMGLLMAIPLSGPVLRTIAPLAGEVSDRFRSAAGLAPMSVIGSLLLALGSGGVLGALPAFAAVKGAIADALREP